MSDITKEELLAMLSVYEKSTQHLEKIATFLSAIDNAQEKMSDKLSNGLAALIISDVKSIIIDVEKRRKEEHKLINESCVFCKNKLIWLTFLSTSIAVVVAVSMVIIKLIEYIYHTKIF